MREHRQHADLGDDAAAARIDGEFIGHPVIVEGEVHVIERRQAAVDESLARRHQVAHVAIFVQRQIDRTAQGLFLGRGRHRPAPLRIDDRVLGDGVERVQLQHVAEEGPHAGFQPR